MRCLRVLFILALIGCFGAAAQYPAPPEKPRSKRTTTEKGTPQSTKKGAPEEGKPGPAPIDLKGDEIALKSGAVLKGVQVFRRGPTDIEVEVIPGVTLRIPRKQIVDIKYDDVEPTGLRQPGASAPAQKIGNLIPGKELKPELAEKLMSPLPAEPPIKYENTDLVTIFGDLGQRLGITIVVDDAVKALPPGSRLWGFEAKAGTSLMALLQDDFLRKFRNLGVVYQYDKLLVTTKEKADALAAQEASPPTSPPAGPARAVAPAALPAPAPAPPAPAR
jgi:hypothetical protein